MTAKIKMHAFFVLIIAALGVGILSGLESEIIISSIKQGFGNTLGAIGIVIVVGTSLGVVLEKTGAAISMADLILKRVGKKNSSLAMCITGLIFGIPIFCDSGFVVLSPLNKSLARRSHTSMAVMAVSLASSLFAVHCFIPPHPGATAAAGIVGVDVGKLMLIGILISVPTAAVGFIWANTFGKKYNISASGSEIQEEINEKVSLPNPYISFIPILLPILLIALKSILALFNDKLTDGFLLKTVSFIGDPSVALLIGLAVSFTLVSSWKKENLDNWLSEGVINAGSILAITAAGGAFGAILKATNIGDSIGNILAPLNLGIILPFLIAAGMKTAQGSSTVAIITTASLITPLLPELHLDSGWGPILTVLSMGAGSMVVSHANDSYFWVVTKFSDLNMETSLKVFTSATLLMGISAELIIYIISIIAIN
jgi:GntP family gluconate:H+ symporter